MIILYFLSFFFVEELHDRLVRLVVRLDEASQMTSSSILDRLPATRKPYMQASYIFITIIELV